MKLDDLNREINYLLKANMISTSCAVKILKESFVTGKRPVDVATDEGLLTLENSDSRVMEALGLSEEELGTKDLYQFLVDKIKHKM